MATPIIPPSVKTLVKSAVSRVADNILSETMYELRIFAHFYIDLLRGVA